MVALACSGLALHYVFPQFSTHCREGRTLAHEERRRGVMAASLTRHGGGGETVEVMLWEVRGNDREDGS
jgi:hypothetical protein